MKAAYLVTGLVVLTAELAKYLWRHRLYVVAIAASVAASAANPLPWFGS